MNIRKSLLITPLVVAAVCAWGVSNAAQPMSAGNQGNGKGNGNGNGRWSEVFQGTGNVTQTRCLGMSRGPNCITAASRKDAARRLQAQLAAAEGGASAPDAGNGGSGGHQK